MGIYTTELRGNTTERIHRKGEGMRLSSCVLVANSFTGELFPVDQFTVTIVLRLWEQKLAGRKNTPWHERHQTILDLLLAGF